MTAGQEGVCWVDVRGNGGMLGALKPKNVTDVGKMRNALQVCVEVLVVFQGSQVPYRDVSGRFPRPQNQNWRNVKGVRKIFNVRRAFVPEEDVPIEAILLGNVFQLRNAGIVPKIMSASRSYVGMEYAC